MLTMELPGVITLGDPWSDHNESDLAGSAKHLAFMMAGKVLQSAQAGAAKLTEAAEVVETGASVTVASVAMLVGMLFAAGDSPPHKQIRNASENVFLSPDDLRCLTDLYAKTTHPCQCRIR